MPEPYVEGERPLIVARQHIAIFIPYAVICTCGLAVGLGVLQLVDASLLLAAAVAGKLYQHWIRYQRDPAEQWHHFGRFVAFWVLSGAAGLALLRGLHSPAWLVLVLVVAVLLAFRLLEWHYHTYTLTNQRVITSYGVFSRVSESLGIEKVQATTLRRGVIARFFGYGDIYIISAGKGQELMRHIADADAFTLALLSAMSGEASKAGVVERFVSPTYEPGSGYAPPLGWGSGGPGG